MSLTQPGDFTYYRAGLHVYHLHSMAMGYVEALSGGVDGEVVPGPDPAYNPRLPDEEGLTGQVGRLLRLLRRKGGASERAQDERAEDERAPDRLSIHRGWLLSV